MIQCPNCNSNNTIVLHTREREAAYLWRSRTCKECGKNFSTREYSLEELAKLIDEGKESLDIMRGHCDELLSDLQVLISQYSNTKESK
jgi:transcriptional regulator NrdR family protein